MRACAGRPATPCKARHYEIKYLDQCDIQNMHERVRALWLQLALAAHHLIDHAASARVQESSGVVNSGTLNRQLDAGSAHAAREETHGST
jgi:hypothetical protein